MKKIIIALMFINLYLPLFASEYVPTFEEYFKQRIEEITITPNDKMSIKYQTGWAVRHIGVEGLVIENFEFKNIKFNFIKNMSDRKLFLNKEHKFTDFIFAIGGEVEKKLNDFYKLLEEAKPDTIITMQNYNTEASRKKMRKYALMNKKMIEEIVNAFNKQISTSEEARERVLKVYLKYAFEQEKDLIRKEYNEKYNKKLSLLYVFGGVYYGGHVYTAITKQIGLRFNHYFLNPSSKFNLGFLFECSYLAIEDLIDKDDSFPVNRKYLFFNIGLSLKIFGRRQQHSFHFGAGYSPMIKIDNIDDYTYVHNKYGSTTYTFNYKKFVSSISLNFEYLYIAKNSGISFFAGVFLQFALSKPYNGEGDMLFSALGVRFGLGFNLN